MELGTLISVSELSEALDKFPDTVKVLDASWHQPISKRDGLKEYHEVGHIPVAQFFDLEECRDKSTDFEFMLPSIAEFESYVGNLGIRNDDHVVLYENEKAGFYSSPRVWWMFRVFGHDKVSILNGGYTRWEDEGKPHCTEVAPVEKRTFKATFVPSLVRSLEGILQNMKDKQCQVVDTRSVGRFTGAENEPIGIPGGHMPESLNLPFKMCMTKEPDRPYQLMKDVEELEDIFKKTGIDLSKLFIASCGTGMTACTVVLAAYLCGKRDIPVFDGSWMEYYFRQVKREN